MSKHFPLEYRSDAASAVEYAGLRAQGPRLAFIVGLVLESLDLKKITHSYVNGLGQGEVFRTRPLSPMIFKLTQAAEKSWHRLRGHNQLPKVIRDVKFTDGIEVVRLQAQTAAA
jgi:hypothetical protein